MLSRTQVEKVQWLEISFKNYVVEVYLLPHEYYHILHGIWHIFHHVCGTYVWYFIAILLFKIKKMWYIIFYYLWSTLKFKEMIIKQDSILSILPLFSLAALSASLPAPESWLHLRGSAIGLFLVLGGCLLLQVNPRRSLFLLLDSDPSAKPPVPDRFLNLKF